MAKKNIEKIKDKNFVENISETFFEDEMNYAFNEYSTEVIVNRAIPDVRDGLKPVQRKILYSMKLLGLDDVKPHKKSARIVGDVMGKFHPHGDSAIYGALVKLAQNFYMRYPLVDKHGNFGNIDGDDAAAMRYTESRLTKMALDILSLLTKDTVDFVDTFDSEDKEPVVLPSYLPNLLLNGSNGLAVGYVCNIPPHNLKEVCNAFIALIDNPDITLKEIMKYIKGPDFPTGGVLQTNTLQSLYESGNEKVIVRSNYNIKENSNKKTIVFTDIPYQVKKIDIVKEIKDLIEKKQVVGLIEVRDETDKTGLYICVDIRKDVDENYILQELFKNTELEKSYSYKFNVLIPKINEDNKKTLILKEYISLKEIMMENLKFSRTVFKRKTEFELQKLKKEENIVMGFLICLKNSESLDKTLNLIRKSKNNEEAIDKLMKEFPLNKEQASAITEMRLRRITALEKKDYDEKYKNLKIEIKELSRLLASEKNIDEQLKLIFSKYITEFGDDRKTKLVKSFAKCDIEKPIVEFYVVYNDKQFKTYQTSNFKAEGISFKTNDNEYFIVFDKEGDFYKYEASKMPSKIPYEPVLILNTDFNSNQKNIVFFTLNGLCNKIDINEFNIARGLSKAIKLNEDDKLIFAKIDDDSPTLIVSDKGNYALFNSNDLEPKGRGTKGVKAILLEDNEKVSLINDKIQERELLIKTDIGEYKFPIKSLNKEKGKKQLVRIPSKKYGNLIVGISLN